MAPFLMLTVALNHIIAQPPKNNKTYTKEFQLSLAKNFRMMATYNKRMNEQLLNVCKQLSHEQLHKETNSFFSTIMCYWNHIIFGDLIMLSRLVKNKFVHIDPNILQQLPTAKTANDTFVNNLKELIKLREIVDDVYIDITHQLTNDDYDLMVNYTTSEGVALEKNVAEFLQHVFNHQTHHRGQLTCILSQMGLDYGHTDLPILVPEGTRI